MARLDDRLDRLATLSPAALRDEWRTVYGKDAARLPADLLIRGIAYRLQEKAGRGLSASILRSLAGGGPVKAPATPRPVLAPGTQLVRSWQGRTIRVEVEQDGFVWERRRYASLTRIAREITGAGWSGPRFFGLTAGGGGDG